jgi:hypothetical protein
MPLKEPRFLLLGLQSTEPLLATRQDKMLILAYLENLQHLLYILKYDSKLDTYVSRLCVYVCMRERERERERRYHWG